METDLEQPVWRQKRRLGSTWLLLALAGAPFVVNSIVVWMGMQGYGWQLLYKSLLLAAPVFWRFHFGGHRGLACIWPVNEPLPSAATWGVAVSLALTMAGAAICTILGLGAFLDLDPHTLRAEMDARFTLTPPIAIVIVVYLFSFNAALEELHFRAWFGRELAERWGVFAGFTISATGFAAMHFFVFAGMSSATFGVMFLMFVALFFAGVCWSLIARQPGGIHAAWLCHGLTNVGLMTWGLFWLDYL